MEGSGEGCGFFSSLKLPYLSQQFCRRLLVDKGFITWSKKDFFLSRDHSGKSRAGKTTPIWPIRWPIRTQDPLQYKLNVSFTYWLCRCRVGDWVTVVSNCTMGWSCGTQFCVASVLNVTRKR